MTLNFNNAIVRTPSRSVTQGLRAIDTGAPNYEALFAEHAAYVFALEQAGVAVDVLPPLEAYPDSVFVEDAALVFTNAAIQLRPGAPTRAGEGQEIAPTLARRFERVFQLTTGTAEGGDILTTPRGVMIGQSARTSADGAQALVSLLAQLGLKGIPVQTPPGVLHFKSDCSLLDDETVLATPALAASGVFDGLPRRAHARGRAGRCQRLPRQRPRLPQRRLPTHRRCAHPARFPPRHLTDARNRQD